MAFAVHFPGSNSRPAYTVRYPSWPTSCVDAIDASPLTLHPADAAPLADASRVGHPPQRAASSIYGLRQERTKISPTFKLAHEKSSLPPTRWRKISPTSKDSPGPRGFEKTLPTRNDGFESWNADAEKYLAGFSFNAPLEDDHR